MGMTTPQGRNTFRFRRFSIRQDRCAMKVGTDGVLLGAWAELPDAGCILDVGTGTGLIALMAAQRSEAHVVGIELDVAAAAQAADNAAASPWRERMSMVQGDFATFPFRGIFRCILANPPYYDNQLLPPDAARRTARHSGSLPFPVLVRRAAELLEAAGTLSVVLPVSEEVRFATLCAASGFRLLRRTAVCTTPAKPPSRVLLTYGRQGIPQPADILVLQDTDGSRSAAYAALTADFYIK